MKEKAVTCVTAYYYIAVPGLESEAGWIHLRHPRLLGFCEVRVWLCTRAARRPMHRSGSTFHNSTGRDDDDKNNAHKQQLLVQQPTHFFGSVISRRRRRKKKG
jgi:hypothetical protein